MTGQAPKKSVTPATKEQLIAAHAHSICKLVQEAASASAGAARHANSGEVNIAISYLLEIEPLLKTIAALNDAALAIHRS